MKHILTLSWTLLAIGCSDAGPSTDSGQAEPQRTSSSNLAVAHQATTSTPTPTTCEQLLQPVEATASSIEGSNWVASKAIDGNTGTRWSSAFSDPQWLKLDLGASKAISKVVLSWQNSYSTDYDIQVSATGTDGSWTTVYTQPTGDGGTDEISGLTATGRYLRMYSRQRKTQYGNSLWEVKVYENTCPCQEKIQPLSATASSIEGSNWVASKAIDDNFSSRWSSAFSDPQWLSIDLGAAYDLNRVVLHWQNSASADYDLQVSSNGSGWTTVYTNSNGQSSATQDIANLTAQGRYLRVYSRARTTQYGVSLWEVEAFQETCNTCTPTGTSEAVCNGVDDDCDGAIDENYQPTVTSCGVGACAAAGMTACVNGAVTNSCTPGTPAASDATCNGVDDDCNGQVDEDFVGQATSCGVGACAATGVQSCVNGSVVQSCTPGTPATSDATCDDVDDDCDGVKDENYASQPSTCGTGACAATGTISCTNGSVVNSCAPSAPGASDASCNGVDDDCNGAVDEDYPAVATSCGVGACSATGLAACLAGNVIDSCTPGAAAAADATCNGVDDDCDGVMDENYVSVPTSCGVGGCTNAGATSCVNGAVLDGCVPLQAAADDSLCDGVDTDCDGETDEGYLPVPATCGVGQCASTGVTSCVSGAVHSSCVPGDAAADDTSCDGLDNDCNSEIDEDYVPLPTSCGIGECTATGATSCVSGAVQNSCAPGNAASDDSLCDGLDNDCNGAIDEDYVPLATSCGVGACADTGVTSCVAGSVVNSCSPGTPGADDVTCDLVDDDCDGMQDEDYLPENTTCGVGECARAGATSCVDGDIEDSCAPGAATADDSLCDGLDNDCSGDTDEDYVVSCAGDAVVACENGATVTTSCSNDDVCDGEESCSLGVCGVGTPPSMDDGNPCTTDACDPQDGISHDPVTAGTACADDGNACNGSETCDGEGQCVEGSAPIVDDNNPCTADACDPVVGVSHTAVAAGTACGDATVCNGSEICDEFAVCHVGTPLLLNDGNPCTDDACDPVLGVSHAPAPVGTSCDDSDVCNGIETCDGLGICVAGTPPTVDDGNVCTDDHCNPISGVFHTLTPVGTPCPDDSLCNGDETCSLGVCVPGIPPETDDANPCTADDCDPLLGAVNTPFAPGDECNYGNVCDGIDTCDEFAVCNPTVPAPVVDDANPCTTDTCDPFNGVSHTPVASGVPCTDQTVCNGQETCDGTGTCLPGSALVLDDGNVCTVDTCHPQAGVSHAPAPPDTACSDGDACNGEESCDPSGTCIPGSPTVVSDSNPCTADTCDAMIGVQHTPVPQGTACADNDLCNGDEQCDGAGICSAGSPITIDDQDSCTFDSCDPLMGLVHTAVPAGTPCDDGDLCNGDDECNELGECVTTNSTVPQDDADICTLNFCNPESGDHIALCTAVNATVASRAGNNLAFIYEGPDAPQTGLDPEAIDVVRAGAITGLVLDSEGNGVSGVQIRALGYPELGTTISHLDGRFDFVVNGGGPITLSYVLAGYLEAQRQVTVEWGGFAVAPDVVLIGLDPVVTTIDLEAPVYQVARGSVVTDSDGTRQATMLFPAGTTASLIHADGTTEPLSELNVRATEFTIGDAGADRMPADLPPTSGYTYAVELSVDEMSVDAPRVDFNQMVPFYVDNFLNIPVGVIVPMGYYDRIIGQWIASSNGQVIKILTITSGAANIDGDGNGSADSAAQLTALGITLQERQQLAALYTAGKTLWRTPVNHFTPWDCNFPYGPPPGACGPNMSCAGTPAPAPPPHDPKPNKCPGSIMECQNQVLRESVPVAGTPFSLEYNSDRTAGYHVDDTLVIPVTGTAALPATAKRAHLVIEIAGRQFKSSFTTAPNQVYSFTWDGLDRFGRPLQGKQPVTVKHGYTYDAVYMRPAQLPQAFAQISGTPLSANRTRRELTLWNTTKYQLGSWFPNSDGLGGWSLNEHHSFDPERHVILRGDGEEEDPNDFLSEEILTEAGTGSQGAGADGPDARNSALALPGGVAAAPDGSLYVADTLNSRIRRIARDGTLTTVVGDSTISNLLVNSSNEAPIPVVNQIPGWTVATGTTWQSRSLNPTPFEGTNYFYAGQVASGELRQDVNVSSFAPIIDAGQQDFTFEGRVRSFDQSPLDASRIIVEYRDANNQVVLQSYDSGQIRQSAQWLQLLDTRFAPIGTRWIRVRLIATRFSGANNDGYFDALSLRSGSDLQATTPLSFPRGVAIGPDGSLYVADTNNNRIRKLDPSGMLSTVAGSGVAGFAGDNGPATTANLNGPSAIAVAPDGTLYIADTDNFRIRRVSTSGMISTLAGTGTSASNGNNGPARSAAIGAPEGITIMPDGTILISERTHHVVRSIASDGIIRAFAGTTSTSGFLGDGGMATAARLNSPTGLFAASDGRVFIADRGNHRIRLVQPSRTIVTFAGTGTAGYSGDRGYILAANLNAPSAITQSSDGDIHIADTNNHRIRRVSATLPGFDASDILVGSENGSEAYQFSDEGLHLATFNALTGATLYSFAYDSQSRLITITDQDGKQTHIERNSQGQPTAIVGPYGQTTTLALNPSGYLETITDPEGQSHELDYVAGGLLSHFTNPNGGVSELVYDAAGRLLTDKNAVDATITLARNELTNGATVTRTTELGRAASFTTQDQPNGDQLRTTQSPDGTQTVEQRLKSGITTTTLPNQTQITTQRSPHPLWGTAVPLTTQTTQLPSGLQRIQAQSESVTLANPNDPFSVLTRTETTTLNGRSTVTAYDPNTRTFTTTSPEGRQTFRTIDETGRTLSTQIEGLTPIDFTYDTDGRLETITQGDRVTTNAYHTAGLAKGYLETITNALNQTTSFTPDGLGRTLSQVEPDGAIIGFTYDGNSNLTSVTPPGKPEHIQTYTPVNQMETYEPPVLDDVPTPATTYTYNADKQLTNTLRPDGVSLSRTYDSAGRLELITMPTGTIQHEYYDNTVCVGCAPGSLKRMTGPGSSIIDLTYDGSLLKSSTWSGAVAGSVAWTHDNDFRTATETVAPGGSTITYAYDNDSLVTCASRGSCAPPSTDALKLTYHPTTGLLTSVVIGNVSETFTYNDKGELATHTASYSGSPVYSGTFHSTAAPRDNLGRITRKVETVAGVTRTDDYQYDTRGRLLNVARNGDLVSVYDYDDNGNRLSLSNPSTSTTTLGSYDDQDRVTTYGSFEYTFNANGDLESKLNTATNEETTYEYDARGALLSAVLHDSTVIEYVVDAYGRRIGKNVNGVTTQGFLYDQLRVAAEIDASGAIISQFVYADATITPDFMIKGGQVYRLIKDQLESPRVVINALTGAIAQHLEYDEFGNLVVDSAPGFQPFGFAGGVYDQDTALLRFGVRDYDPATGRWTTKDPLGFAAGNNVFAYTNGDPINFVDPTGLEPRPGGTLTWPLDPTNRPKRGPKPAPANMPPPPDPQAPRDGPSPSLPRPGDAAPPKLPIPRPPFWPRDLPWPFPQPPKPDYRPINPWPWPDPPAPADPQYCPVTPPRR